MSKPSKICNKVKNPCKICLRTVTDKTGLQCCGACQSWVHYACSNYTPGKIQDIKKGIIKVNCPCPDCETQLPKEYRTDKPKSCANQQCPANRPPKCDNKTGCPAYDYDPPPGTPGYQDNMNQVPSNQWPGSKCGADCKKYPSDPDVSCGQPSPMQPSPPQPPMMPAKLPPPKGPRCGRPECKLHNPPAMPMATQMPMSMPMPMPMPMQMPMPMPYQLPYRPSGELNTSHDCQARPNVGDTGRQMMPGIASFNSQQPSFSVVEQMCTTVGLLSKQINELMCKMKETMQARGAGSGSCGQPCVQAFQVRGPAGTQPCVQTGNKSNCPQPCQCPENPRNNINIRR